jgi:hypothetical protein
MANKNEKQQLKHILSRVFAKDDNVSFYFLKKTKLNPEFEYKVPFKTKKKTSTEKIKSIQKNINFLCTSNFIVSLYHQ